MKRAVSVALLVVSQTSSLHIDHIGNTCGFVPSDFMDQEMDLIARPLACGQSAGADRNASAKCRSDAEQNIPVASDGRQRSRLQMSAILTALFVRLSLFVYSRNAFKIKHILHFPDMKNSCHYLLQLWMQLLSRLRHQQFQRT
jgi:hypothetical protein